MISKPPKKQKQIKKRPVLTKPIKRSKENSQLSMNENVLKALSLFAAFIKEDKNKNERTPAPNNPFRRSDLL